MALTQHQPVPNHTRRSYLPGTSAHLRPEWVGPQRRSVPDHSTNHHHPLGKFASTWVLAAKCGPGCRWFLRAAEWRPPNLHAQWQLILANRWEALTVAVIIVVAFAVRVVNLEVFPYAFANDEAWVGLEGLHILTGEPMGFFTVGWSSQPMLSFLPDALFVAIFGQTITAVRLVSVLTGTFTVLGLYLLVREVSQRKTALLAAGFLALLAPHIHFSRTAFHNILPGFSRFGCSGWHSAPCEMDALAVQSGWDW